MLAAAGQVVLSRVKPQFLQSINSTLAVAAIFLLVMLIVMEVRNAFNKYRASSGRRKALPGPWGIPVLGNVFQLGSKPHERFVEMAKNYGDVFRIHIGSRMVVVLNGYDTIRQALVKQSVDFAGRPDITTFKYFNTWRGFPSLAFSPYNQSWKLHRKIAESTFRHFTSGRQVSCVEQKVKEEATDLVSYLSNNGNESGNIIDPENIIKASVANILYSFLLSRRRPLDDKRLLEFLSMSNKFDKAVGTGNPVDFMPWLRFFPNKKLRDFKEIVAELQNLLAPDIADHHAEYQVDSDRDMLDHLITVSRSIGAAEKEHTGITEEQILGTVTDFFGAGFGTVAAALHWFILYSMKYTDMQERIHHELDEVVGRDCLPDLSHRGLLPYTEACILEILRHSSLLPMGIPHATTKDTTLNGYFIPENTVVFVNLYSVSYDESRLDNPQEFNPSRFLTADGTALDPAKTDLLMPFGAGRRRCVGSELARTELFLYCTHLMHQCNFATPEGQEINMEPRIGLALTPQTYQVKITSR